ncbi:hypothetical protein BDZ89DRAFT_1158787 [Hymenopellis radicata]|nr:hypothetical protein BDZ89DRAFT_1158787 [Hymenopellis radicata]
MSTKNPIPYVSGLALSQAQVDAMAQLSLSDEEISRSGTTHRAIIDLMEQEKQKTTLVPFFRKGERYYLFVAVVVPSFDGSDPKMTVPKRIFNAFRKIMAVVRIMCLTTFMVRAFGGHCVTRSRIGSILG